MGIDDELLLIEFELEEMAISACKVCSTLVLVDDVADLIDGGSGNVVEDEWCGLLDGVLVFEAIDGIGFDVAFASMGCCPFMFARSDSNNLSLFVLLVVVTLLFKGTFLLLLRFILEGTISVSVLS